LARPEAFADLPQGARSHGSEIPQILQSSADHLLLCLVKSPGVAP
jgi:hypothetical protein